MNYTTSLIGIFYIFCCAARDIKIPVDRNTMPSLCNGNEKIPLNTQLLSKFAHIRDAQVIYPLLVNVESYALATMPRDTVYITTSSIPNAGLGVFAARPIARLSYFGPYCCKKYNNSIDRKRTHYTWEVHDKSGNIMHYIDGSELNKSNWLRYINCPENLHQQNLVAFVVDESEIFYLVTRDIPIGQELLVYYGDTYAKKLGIDTTKFS